MSRAPIEPPTDISLPRQLVAEGLGTSLLVAAIVGSCIAGDQLSGGNVALAVLATALTQGAILVVLISIFTPVSGAHLNPAVTLAFVLRRDTPVLKGAAFAVIQIVAGITGTMLAHLMFGMDPIELGTKVHWGPNLWLGEAVATFALVITILACLGHRPEILPYAVGLVITAGNWYTSSGSFANPAVTLARALTDSFASIRPVDALPFITMEFVGALLAVAVAAWLFSGGTPSMRERSDGDPNL
jgi:glycerol uptake facilitator-like aquaporin